MDNDSVKHIIEAGSLVIGVGMNAKTDLALTFYGVADRFCMIGDCEKARNIQKAMRSAFTAASLL